MSIAESQSSGPLPAGDLMARQRLLVVPGGREHGGVEVTAELLATSLADAGEARQALRKLGVRGRARAIARVGAWWAAACAAPVMEAALADSLARGAREAELSVEMLRWGIAATLGTWTEDALIALVERELGSVAAVDSVHAVAHGASVEHAHRDIGERAQEAAGERAHGAVQEAAEAAFLATLAVPPQVCVQVLARTVPPAGWQSMAFAWLLGAAVVVRPSAHLIELVRAFVASLARIAPELAAVTWISCSHADDAPWRHVLAQHADAIVVHGSDDAVSAWRAAARPDALLVPHGHKTSAAFLAVEGLDEPALSAHLRGLAEDLCAWDQLGCLSPVTLYVAEGGAATPDRVARRLAQDPDALPAVERALPPGPWSKAVLAERTLFVRARLLEARAYASETAQILVYEAPGPLEPSCLHRVLLVRPIASLDALVAELSKSAPHLQSLAVGGSTATRAELAVRLAPYGLNRACAPGELQRPPVWWSHDGRGCLRPLVRWVDLA